MYAIRSYYVECEECKGARYNKETLEIKYKEKSISDVLNMSVEEAMEHFKNIPQISNKLKTLYDVGLGYIKLGQSSTTLSGGEAQRIKLTRELSKRATGKTIYLLDEPTTGLHFHDVKKLIDVLDSVITSYSIHYTKLYETSASFEALNISSKSFFESVNVGIIGIV